MSFERHENLLAEIATLYFRQKMTQVEIASIIGYSRSAVSRLLTEAEQRGIVEINIKFPIERLSNLENQIKTKFGIENVFVVKRGTTPSQTLVQVGQLGAWFAENLLRENGIVGISWGTGVFEVVNAFSPKPINNLKVVQIIGSTGGKSDPNVDGPVLARHLANKFNATYFILPAPLVVGSSSIRDLLLSERDIQSTLQLAYQADFALVGVGSVEPIASSSFLRSGYLTQEEILEVNALGGTGNICGTIYDKNGKVLNIDINHRLVAIDLLKLCASSCKIIGVAVGEHKVPPILGALKGKLIDILVTDSSAAEMVIATDD